jgi:tetratricopeptide (TPR) repeat protein
MQRRIAVFESRIVICRIVISARTLIAFRTRLRPAAFSLLTLLLASVCMSSALFAQATSVSPAPYVILGSVSLPDGSLAGQVAVRLTSTTGYERQMFTDDNGRYEFRDLPRGHYFLSASNPEDRDQVSDDAEVDTSRAFITRITVNLSLRYKPVKAVQQPAGSPVITAKESAQHVPRKALKVFDRGVKFSREGKAEQAEQELTRALRIFPDYFQAFCERGSLYIAQGRIAEAREDFQRALQINPEYGPALCGFGICEFHLGKYIDAIDYLEKAVTAEPTVSRNYFLLALAYGALDRWGAARMAFLQALNLDPKGAARAHFHLANIYIRENRLEEAISELDAYLSTVPDAPDKDEVLALKARLRQKQ